MAIIDPVRRDSPVKWSFPVNSPGAAHKPATIPEIANILLAARGISPPPTVGVNWVSSFVKRHDELHTGFSKRYNHQSALNEDRKLLKKRFATVEHVTDENGIQPEDIYNFDETGFATGLISAQKVLTRKEYYSWRSLHPGNCEWVTAIGTICADDYSLPLCVILRVKLPLRVGLLIYHTTGDLRSQIRAGLLIRLVYVGYSNYLFHQQITWSISATNS